MAFLTILISAMAHQLYIMLVIVPILFNM